MKVYIDPYVNDILIFNKCTKLIQWDYLSHSIHEHLLNMNYRPHFKGYYNCNSSIRKHSKNYLYLSMSKEFSYTTKLHIQLEIKIFFLFLNQL